MTQELILIRGLPGSGKSTFAKELYLLLGGGFSTFFHWETDMFFSDDGFDPGKLSEAHKWCQNCVRQNLWDGMSVIVSNTFSRIWEMQPYLDMAKEYNAKVTVITCEGDYGNIHGVPQSTIDKMRNRWEPYPKVNMPSLTQGGVLEAI